MKVRTVQAVLDALVVNPFVSQAQRAACFAKKDPDWDCDEWQRKTGKRKLPKRVTNARLNPLLTDPTRTGLLRRTFRKHLEHQFGLLKGQVVKHLIVEQALGPLTGNALSEFASDPANVEAFKQWLQQLLGEYLLSRTEEELWNEYIQQGYKKGAGRAFDDFNTAKREDLGYTPSQEQFLQESFAHPVSVDKVKLLAGRSYDELKNVTSDMSNKMTRGLTDGLVQGKSPREIARDLAKQVGISKDRALLVARTEIIRAHAEGQLMALEKLGVEEVGVAVEWSTSGVGTTRKGYPSPCHICAPLKGIVLKLSEAAGMIPRHPNCMCSWVPANVGEDKSGQIRSAAGIKAAVKKSIEGAMPKSKRKSIKAGKGRKTAHQWAKGLSVSANRPKSIVDNFLLNCGGEVLHRGQQGVTTLNAFCPTGAGGGVDPTCSPTGSHPALPHPSHVTVIKTLGGSTGAQLVEDQHGVKWVMKQNHGNPGHLHNEVQADEAYRALGVPVPHSGIVHGPNGPVKFSRFHEGQTLAEWQVGKTEDQRKLMHAKIAEHLAADAVLANWDVIGLQKDNILVTKDGTPLRIDNGGALTYRAQGSLKGSLFGPNVGEWESLRQSSKNQSAKDVFGHVTDEMMALRSKILLQKKDALLASITDPGTKAIIAQRLGSLESKAAAVLSIHKPIPKLGGLLDPALIPAIPIVHPMQKIVLPPVTTPQPTVHHLHSPEGIKAHFQANPGPAQLGTETYFAKMAHLNPQGIKGGVFTTPNMGAVGEKAKEHLEYLKKILPAGTVIKKTNVTLAKAVTGTAAPVVPKKKYDLPFPGKLDEWGNPVKAPAPKGMQKKAFYETTPLVSPEHAKILHDLATKLSAVPKKSASAMFKTYKEIGYKYGFQTTQEAMKAAGLPQIDSSWKMKWAANAPKTSADWKAHLKVMTQVVAKSHEGGWTPPPAVHAPKAPPPVVEVSDVHVEYGPFKFHQAKVIPDLSKNLPEIKSGEAVHLPTWQNNVPQEMTKQWVASLNQGEKNAIDSWKGSASDKRKAMVKQYRSGEWNEHSKAGYILSAMQKHPPVPGVFYRGIHGAYAKEIFDAAKGYVGSGEHWALDKAAHGMSMNAKTSVTGAGSAGQETGTLLRIASKSGRPIIGTGGFDHEAEVLNPPMTKYKVKGVYTNVTVHGKLVPRVVDLEEI